MFPYQMIAGGKFTLSTASIASGVEIELPGQGPTPDLVVARAISGWGEASDAQAIEWFWEKSMSQATAKGILQSSEGSTPQLPAMTSYSISSQGISCYDTVNPPSYTALACTAITGIAGTYVVSMANTGSIAVGDYVQLYSTTGALQMAGYAFQVTAVTSNVSITLGYMASSGITFAADATAGYVKKFIPKRYYPKALRVANITKASQAVIYFTQKNNYTPGENISIRVPDADWGMIEANNKVARVLSVTNSSTVSSITVDLDTSGYSTFEWPTSAEAAAGAGLAPAMVVPSSSGVVPDSVDTSLVQQPPGMNLLDAFDNRNSRVIYFGPGLWNVSGHASDNGDIWMYQAYKYDLYGGQ